MTTDQAPREVSNAMRAWASFARTLADPNRTPSGLADAFDSWVAAREADAA